MAHMIGCVKKEVIELRGFKVEASRIIPPKYLVTVITLVPVLLLHQ
jgi:hypothetical protein